ncbi:hypothetical protein JANAI62_35150 [Jannaschia pagri]|uniref:Hedgehog/Intein (Hint) domain-containing protein n=1 Tax=Jannaschia pagri TaxID=2829797 RepID=A0ABQ4NR51_9RHOB|nr:MULTISPECIES: Hint domain-containing protein [unclassified Jannaschia]GIT93057.1 hypothetical protein JANAI61_35150 [Jannaschia sp. AI_61]GIT96892.1 hypothetical protein JANAI62_35150 [Jannaschia sp. AI_62]
MTVQLRMNAQDLIVTGAQAVTPASHDRVTGGLALGTIVETAMGPMAVEALQPGDRILTRERGAWPLRSVTMEQSTICTIRTDSLGVAQPARDISVATDQHVTLRDWRAAALFDAGMALVPADRLTDGTQIARTGTCDVVRLDLGAPLTIVANGMDVPTGRTETGVVNLDDEI